MKSKIKFIDIFCKHKFFGINSAIFEIIKFYYLNNFIVNTIKL